MGAESSLPDRVNIVCGGRYALSKKEWNDCPAVVVPANKVLTSPKRRNAGSYKWLIKEDPRTLDEHGRPVECIIRNDYHPQRSLRAGERVTLDAATWTAEHRWKLEYVDPVRSTSSVGAAFHLRSMRSSDKQYLTVDETSGTLVMQNARPQMTWQFYDAAGSTKDLTNSFSSLEELIPNACETECDTTHGISDSGYEKLDIVEGNLESAFSVHSRTRDGSRHYTSAETMIAQGELVSDGLVEIASPPLSLFDVYLNLYGPGSRFRNDIAEGTQKQINEVKRVIDAPYCGTATTHVLASVPVLGKRRWEEEIRVALFRDSNSDYLAVQVCGKLAIGFPIGDFLTEQLHLFVQHNPGGPVLFRSFGLAPPGRAQKEAIDGLRAKTLKYIEIARETLNSVEPCGQEVVVTPCSLNGLPESVSHGTSHSNRPLRDAQRHDDEEPVAFSSSSVKGQRVHLGQGRNLRSLPHRINLIYGGRFALAKVDSGDCAAHVACAHDVLTNSSERTCGKHRWFLQEFSEGASCRDENGRIVLCAIRNDYHPQRSLRAGDPVMLDATAWAIEHKWRLEYLDDLDASCFGGTVSQPFHIRSLVSDRRRYLAVDGNSMRLVMQEERPDMVWEMYDALGSAQNVKIRFLKLQTYNTDALETGDKADAPQEGNSETRKQPLSTCVACMAGLRQLCRTA
eukprot:TRINITY_DN49598_c0_g1_i1.p1 TRINITY_DN49598_c0_g1~~TRINITY_DN49598_c0_g1_i1.p1  ORF type:complete len:730 (-),score=28.46 TRINITY_DN49598_c0_g1_i1:49-2091(-)